MAGSTGSVKNPEIHYIHDQKAKSPDPGREGLKQLGKERKLPESVTRKLISQADIAPLQRIIFNNLTPSELCYEYILLEPFLRFYRTKQVIGLVGRYQDVQRLVPAVIVLIFFKVLFNP